MKNLKRSVPVILLTAWAMGSPSLAPMLAQGIPEPSLILYGVIRNVGDGNIRLTSGTLTWQFQPSGGGAIVTRTTGLTNINDQFSYILRVPWETDVGSGVSSNTLRLISTSISYNRAQVSLGNNQITFVQPGQATFSVSSLDRGRIERVDLQVSISCFDTDGNGLCDWWEQQFFGQLGINPNGDGDGDNLTNLAEYQAGTDPGDPNSVFKFISTAANPAGGMRVEWSSVDGRLYTLQRSTDLLTGFTDLVTNIPATEPKNTYLDTTAAPPASYFYRLRLQP